MAQRILYVDDDALLQRLVCDVLDREGFTVSLASNGEEGLTSAHSDPPDLILLDLMMPGMDGFQVCQEIRRHHRLSPIPIVILTAMKGPNLDERAFAAGANMCLTKPFQPDELVSAVSFALKTSALKNARKKMDVDLAT
jgi:DNA-binding response OmpR family regulator